MKTILSTEQVRNAIYQDEDFSIEELLELAEASSSFIKEKTGYDFAEDDVIEPLAIQCAKMYVRQIYFGKSHNREYDYGVGITSMLVDLQNMVDSKLVEEQEDE